MKKFILKLEELDKLVDYVKTNFKRGVIILKGDLASGKTTFVKYMLKNQGIKEDVTSPTFSLQHCYGDSFFHYDIYNHGLEHFISLGMLEELEKDGIHFVEWGDDELSNILNSADIPVMSIEILKVSDDTREYKVCIH